MIRHSTEVNTLGSEIERPSYDTALLVTQGSIDVYLSSVDGETEELGARRILTVRQGSIIVQHKSSNSSRNVLTFVPAAESVFKQYTLENLFGECPNASRLIDEWIISLSSVLCKVAAQPSHLSLLPEYGTSSTGRGSRYLSCKHGVLWARPYENGALFLSASDCMVSAKRLIPVCSHTWLEVGDEIEVDSYSTANSLLPDLLNGLELFESFVAKQLAVSISKTGTRASKRVRKEKARQYLFRTAIQWLVDSRGPVVRSNTPVDSGITDPLLRACDLVAKQVGLSIRKPPDSGLAERQPGELIYEIASASSIRVRRVLLRDRWWVTTGQAFVAFRYDNGQPVAVLPATRRGYLVVHPTGEIEKLSRGGESKLTGVAYTFYRPFPKTGLSARTLLRFGLDGHGRLLTIIMFTGGFTGLLSLAMPVAVGVLVDSAIPNAQKDDVRLLAAFLIIAAIASAMVSITRNLALLRLQGKLESLLQSAIWDRILRLPVSFFRKYSSGDLASRSIAFNEIAQLFTGPVLALFTTNLFSLLSAFVLLIYSWRLAIIAYVLLTAGCALSIACLYANTRFAGRYYQARGILSGLVVELISGIPKLRVSGAELNAFSVWAHTSGDKLRMMVGARKASIWLAIISAGWPLLSTAMIFYAGSATAFGATLSTGHFLAFLTLFNQLMASALGTAGAVAPLLGLMPLYNRARPILEQPLADSGRAQCSPFSLNGTITVRNVSFRYSKDGPEVLRGVSLDVAPGSFTAIVGASGSGKTTLLRLLLAFEYPEAGSIHYDNFEITNLNVEILRKQMGVVLQNGRLPAGSIYELIVGPTGLSLKDAWEAARLTGLDQDISAMPMGMHTVIGNHGASLSGGQRQRVMLARAIINRPRILLLDEATSALDNETQRVVTKTLDEMRVTRIIIAHRLTTIKNADSIIVLDKGVVCQTGSYAALIGANGPFLSLVRSQQL